MKINGNKANGDQGSNLNTPKSTINRETMIFALWVAINSVIIDFDVGVATEVLVMLNLESSIHERYQ